MTPELWRRVSDLFDEVSAREPAERTPFLEQACGDDTELREAVAKLLEADAVASGFLDPPVRTSSAMETMPGNRMLAPSPKVIAGRYRIDAVLGEGGMGTVYKAFDDRLERPVALKLMRPMVLADRTAPTTRFFLEAKLVASLQHPNVVIVHDFGVESHAGAYLVMEYLTGRSLRDEVATHGRLAPADAVGILRHVAAAVHAAHTAGVIHRDLKPENVFLMDAAPHPIVKVLDFGIARVLESPTHLTATGGIVGTPMYMAPEQASGRADVRSDVYALGVILFELLTGRTPFRGDSLLALLRAHAEERPPQPRTIVPDLPQGLEAVVLRCLAKNPDERYATAMDFERALANVVGSGVAAAPAPRVTVPTNLPAKISSFWGREEEFDAIAEAVVTHRLVTVVGFGGVGKSRLSREVAAKVAEQFPDGVFFVNLARATDRAGIDAATSSAIGEALGFASADDPAVRRTLQSRRALIVLDDCDRVRAECSRFVQELQAACPSLHVLATARGQLGVPGEATHEIATLPVPPESGEITVDRMLAYPSVRLFVDRARLNRSNFQLTDKNASSVAAICRRLEGIPLAIVMAAARVRMFSVDQILKRLDDRFAFLERDIPDALPKRRALRAALDWSFDALSERERAYLCELTKLGGSWSFDDAEAACEGIGLGPDQALGLLDRLVGSSLVLVEDDDDCARYRILDTVRDYVRTRTMTNE